MKLTAAVSLLSMTGACTTIMRGTEQSVEFKTQPTGATVYVDGKTYTTPTEVELRRKKTYAVTVSKPEYRTIKFDLDPQWDGVSLVGNMLLPGGSVGMVLDSSNGSDRNFNKLADITLPPSTQPSEPPLVLKDYKGHLLTDTQYAAAVEADKKDRSQFFQGQP